MRWRVALKLGRVSNLPTVWTNVVAGLVLAGGHVLDARGLMIIVAFSLFYIGGMYLNDAFDAHIDARERPERPIPAGDIGRGTVFLSGFAMLAVGIAILAAIGQIPSDGTGLWSAVAGAMLAATIVLYNWHHKENPLSPVLMGLCRVLIYLGAGLCVSVALPNPLLAGAGLLLCYLIGLTYVAKQENINEIGNMWPLAFLAAPVLYGLNLIVTVPLTAVFWVALFGWILVALRFIIRRAAGDIPRAVVSLIAGICLLDAMLIAGAGQFPLALLAVGGFALTLALQRYVPGT